MTTPPVTQPRSEALGQGVVFSLITNLIWASQPLYWQLLKSVNAIELLAQRVIWTTVFCFTGVFLLRKQRELLRLLRWREVLLLASASVCLTVAWGVYIYAVNNNRVVEGSLGLFLIPLTTVLAGKFFFRERLRLWQWIALGGGTTATIILAIGYGRFPFIALILCSLMAVYAGVKKRMAAPVLTGFTLECTLVAILASGFVGWLSISEQSTIDTRSITEITLVIASGILTAVPLLAHAAALNRLSLTIVGILQYLNPAGQFIIGVFILDELMSLTHWIGFTLVWVALVIFTIDSVHQSRATRSSPIEIIPPLKEFAKD